MYNIFLDVLLYPGHDQVSCAHSFSLNATVACNRYICHCTYNLKVAQINLSSYVCIDAHCTLVGSLLVLIQINRGFVQSD